MKLELSKQGQDSNELTDLRLQFEGRLDRKEVEMHSMRDELSRLRDEVRGKDQAIGALSDTLIEKGETNRRLTEKLAEVKNHQLATHFLN